MPDYVDTMAYAGATPWHGLGVKLPEDVDTDTMLPAAGLDWESVSIPAEYRHPITGAMAQAEGNFVIARSDTGAALGVVGSRYVPYSNRELMEFGDALRRQGSVKWHTAGSLKGGRRVWALAQVAGQFEVKRRDGTSQVTAPFLLLSTAHDGTMRVRAIFTGVRVVCWNTLSAALGAGDKTGFYARHTGSLKARVADAIEALGLAEKHFRLEAKTMQELANSPMTPAEFVTFTLQVLTGEDDADKARAAFEKAEGRSKALYSRKGSELINLFARGAGNHGEDRYDALNAITQWVDHQRGRGVDAGNGNGGGDSAEDILRMSLAGVASRANEKVLAKSGRALESAWFGSGATLKQRAVNLLTQ